MYDSFAGALRMTGAAVLSAAECDRLARVAFDNRDGRNGPGAHGCIGLGNGLTPSLMLGCGTYGRNSTTDNVTYTHLVNIKRVAHPLAGIGAPSPT